MNAWDTIDAIAASAGISPNTRRMWRERGVPYRHHVLIITEAAKRGLALDSATLRTPAPKPAPEAAA